MTDFELDFEIYDYNKYIEIVEKVNCFFNLYDDKSTAVGNKFMNDLINLSNKRCYMCGYTLENNTEKSIYVEREHIINKTIDGQINTALNKCKKNIIPICRTCNAKKTTVNINEDLKHKLKILETECKEYKTSTCSFDTCLSSFKEDNFNFNASASNYTDSDKIFFDFLVKTFYGNDRYINAFDLNARTTIIFNNIFKLLYKQEYTSTETLDDFMKMFSTSVLDDNLIDFLHSFKLLNTKKKDNLIETIVLLECL